jgi:putative ABC transport system permease protein
MGMKLSRIAFRNITRNTRRSILSGTAIAVSTMGIILLFALLGGMENDMATNLKSFYTGEIRIQNAQYEQYERYNPLHLGIDTSAIVPILEANPSVTAFTPRIDFPASLYLDGTNQSVLGIGVDFAAERQFSDIETLLVEGRIPEEGKNEMVMGISLARELGLSIGDKATLLSTTAARGSNAITLSLVGTVAFPVAALNANSLWAPIDRVRYFLRMGTSSQQMLLRVAEDADAKEVAAEIKDTIKEQTATDTDTRAWTELDNLYGLLEMANVVYYFIGAFFLFLGSTVIVNTTMMVIFERMREIGTLAALGMKGSELTRLFFLEGLFISIIGAGAGVLLGMVGVRYLGIHGLNLTDAMSGIDMEISSVLYPVLGAGPAFLTYLYAVFISSLATFIPSRRASKIEPVEALRYV